MKRQLAERGGGWMPDMRPGSSAARTLAYLTANGESTLQDVADALQVSGSTATNALRGLVRLGHAEKVSRGRWAAIEATKIAEPEPLTQHPSQS
jgi:hypothetical protein